MVALCSIVVFLGCIVAGSSFQQNSVLEGISLPIDFSSSIYYFPALSVAAATSTKEFQGNYTSVILTLVGKEKSDPQTQQIFKNLHQDYVDYAVKQDLPNGYLFFGNNNNYDNLPYVFKTNAFYTAALRSGPNMTFEIDPFGKRGTTYFSQLTACLSNKLPRVHAIFDSKMNVKKLKVYNATNPTKELTGYSPDEAATFLLYQCSYFAQNVHASIHVSI